MDSRRASQLEALMTARIAATFLMAVRGLLIGSWMAYVPAFKLSFHLDNGQLGLAILCSGSASLLMTVPVGTIIDFAGPKPVAVTTGIISPLLYATLPLLARKGYQPFLPLFLMSMWRAGGSIAYTSRASELERLWGRPLMSSFHAAFSAGAFCGSVIYSSLLSLGFGSAVTFPVLCVITTCGAGLGIAFMDDGMPPRRWGTPADISLPRSLVAASKSCIWTPAPLIICLGLLGALTQLVQGGIGDWGALYLYKYIEMPFGASSLGYSLFACAMGVMRLFGDAWCHKAGRLVVYRSGGFLMMAGLALLLITNNRYVALFSCTVIGAGCANLYPILMSCAGRQSLDSPGLAIATVSSLGLTGLLAGPAIIGFVAQVTSLKVAMSLLVFFSSLVTLASSVIRDDEPLTPATSLLTEDDGIDSRGAELPWRKSASASDLETLPPTDDCAQYFAVDGNDAD